MRVYADRVDEKNAFQALLPKSGGEEPNWEKIHEFIKGAKYMDDDGMFVNVSAAVVERYLIANKKWDDATALTTRLKGLKFIANNDRAISYLDGLLEKIEKGKAEAAEEKKDDDAEGNEKDGEGNDKDDDGDK